MVIPSEIKVLFSVLQEHGYESFVVGGCVRDNLLSRPVHDWDICTNATPQEVVESFEGYTIIPTGIKHGTLSIKIGKSTYEITTYRCDGDYTDGRHPDSVVFVRDIDGDLARRDFTINAMAYNDSVGFMDLYGGQEDIKNRLIRCVGDPYKRFNEDALRIMRAIRFSATLGFSIEENTHKAMHHMAHKLSNISSERIGIEFSKIVSGKYAAKAIRENKEILCKIIPEMKEMIGCEQNNPYHCYDVFEHTMVAMENLKMPSFLSDAWNDDEVICLATFFHDIGKPLVKFVGKDGYDHFYHHAKASAEIAQTVMKRLKYSNKLTDDVVELVSNHDIIFNPTKKCAKRILNKYAGIHTVYRLMKLKLADSAGHSKAYDECEKTLKEFQKVLHDIINNAEPYSMNQIKIDGNDLIDAGYIPSKQFKEMLDFALNEVIEQRVVNTKEGLLKAIKKKFG